MKINLNAKVSSARMNLGIFGEMMDGIYEFEKGSKVCVNFGYDGEVTRNPFFLIGQNEGYEFKMVIVGRPERARAAVSGLAEVLGESVELKQIDDPST